VTGKHCPHAKSDMTLCYNRDSVLAIAEDRWNKHLCVGCERRIYPTNAELTDYEKLKNPRPNPKRRQRASTRSNRADAR
jgi:hypothetical protein